MAAVSSAQRVLDVLHALHRATVGRLAVRAAVAIRVRRVDHARNQRAEPGALHGFARGEGECSHGPTVEAAEEGDDLVAPGSVARQLDSPLHRLRARVAEGDAARHVAGRDLIQLFGQRGEFFVVEIRPRHVDQAGGLLLNGFHHPRMAVPGGHYGDAGREIEEAVAIHVFHDGALAFLRYKRIAAAFDDGPRARTRHGPVQNG